MIIRQTNFQFLEEKVLQNPKVWDRKQSNPTIFETENITFLQ